MDEELMKHGAVSWYELMSDDVDSSLAFYTSTFGWQVEDFAMPEFTYKVLKVGERPFGGIMPKPPEMASAPNGWIAYVSVTNIDESVAAVVSNGGQVTVPPFDIPGVGRGAHVLDPGNAVIALMQYAQPEG